MLPFMIMIIILLYLRTSRSFLPEANKARTRSPTQPTDSNAWVLSLTPWKSMRKGAWHSNQHSVRNGKRSRLGLYCPKPHCQLVVGTGLELPTWCSFHTIRSCLYYTQCCSESNMLWDGKRGPGVSHRNTILQ